MTKSVRIEEVRPGSKRLLLCSPENLNAMNESMAQEFQAAVSELQKDTSLRLLSICGEGRAFSSGGNIEMLRAKTKKSRKENVAEMISFYESFLCIRHIPVPTIAVLHGHAIGAGLCLALACDFRVAATEAKLGLNFLKIGLHPGMGATYFLPKLIGLPSATEVLLSARILSADEAKTYGFVNAVYPSENFSAEVEKYLAQFEGNGPMAARALKQTLSVGKETELQEALQREAEAQAINFESDEFLEGLEAVKEKRLPRY